MENENREEAQEKKEKRSFKPRLVWKRMALGIGVLCLVVILGVVIHYATKSDKGKDTKNGIQVASMEDTKKQAKTVATKQDNWDLFQTEDSVISLTVEEKSWIALQLEKFAKGKDQAAWEENLLLQRPYFRLKY